MGWFARDWLSVELHRSIVGNVHVCDRPRSVHLRQAGSACLADRNSTSASGPRVGTAVSCRAADEHHGQLGGRRAGPTELRAQDEWLYLVHGCVWVASDTPSWLAPFEDQLWRAAKACRLPEHDVGELADLYRTDLVGQPMRDRGVDGELGEEP